jgi:hypothetical protein
MRNLTAIAALSLLFAASAAAQSTIPGWSEKTPTHTQVVAFVAPVTATVIAGKPAELELRFSIREGMHINAHTPSYPELIPTTLSADEGSDVELLETKYPDGSNLMLGSNPPEKLNVYTGEFLLHAKVRAKAGQHTLKLKLRYQACTMSACMPPRTIPLTVDLIAK